MVFDGFIGKEYREIRKPRGKHSDNSKMYQLKIALEGIEPKIWRRFLVEDWVTFHELHRAIQVVMGWGNYHAYEFLMEDGRIEGEGDLGFCVDHVCGEDFLGFLKWPKSNCHKRKTDGAI